MPSGPATRRTPPGDRLGLPVASLGPRRGGARRAALHAARARRPRAGRGVHARPGLLCLLPHLPSRRGRPARASRCRGRLGRLPLAPSPQRRAPRGAGGRAGALAPRSPALRQLGRAGGPEGGGMTASVVLPTYNERDVIVGVVEEILEAVGDVEVVVVDDDSPDRTWEAVETAFAGDGRARALRRLGRRGLPSAIAEGIAASKGDVVVWLDAAGSMPADAIPRLVAATATADVAVASRYAAGGRDARESTARILASRAINAFGTVWLGGPVRDWTSGFVAARRSALQRVPIRSDH